MKTEMTSKERFYANLRGEEADRPAVINPVSLATSESCRILGIPFNEVHLNADKMAALAAYGSEGIGFDCAMPYFSVVAEASALGAKIVWGDNENMPWQKDAIYTDPGQFKLPADFLERPAIKTILDSIRLLKKRLGDKTLIIGKAMGPWTLSMHLYGVENALMDSMLEPEKLQEFIRRFKEITRTFAQAQFEAGADIVTIADHATSNLISPDAYVRYIQKAHQELNREFGKNKLVLHCCGYTLDRIRHFADGGFSLFHFESANPIGEALQLAGGMKLTGCVNDPVTLLQGTPEDVRTEVENIIRQGIRILSPECAVPLRTPNENLKEIVRTAAGLN